MGDPLSVIGSTFTILEATVKVSRYILHTIGEYRGFHGNLSKIYSNVRWTSDILIELEIFILPEKRSLAEGGPPRRNRSWYNRLQTVLQSCEGILRRLNEKIVQYQAEPSWNRNKLTWAIAGSRDIRALNVELTLERAEIVELFDFARLFREQALTRGFSSNTRIQFLRQNLHKAVALHKEMAENGPSTLEGGQKDTALFSTQPSAVETGDNYNYPASNIDLSHRRADQTSMAQAVGLENRPSGHGLSNDAAQKPHEPQGDYEKSSAESSGKEPVVATDTAADVHDDLAEPSKPPDLPNGASTLVRTLENPIDNEPTEVVEHHEQHSNINTITTEPASRRTQPEQRLTSTGNADGEQSQPRVIHDENTVYTHDRDQSGPAHSKQQTPAEEREGSVHHAPGNEGEAGLLNSDDELYTYDRDQPGTARSKQQTSAEERAISAHDALEHQGEAMVLHSDDELNKYDRDQPNEIHVREVTKYVAGLENNLEGRGRLNRPDWRRPPPPRRATVESDSSSFSTRQRTPFVGRDESRKSRREPRAVRNLHRPREDNSQGLQNSYLGEKYMLEKSLDPVGLVRSPNRKHGPSRLNWVPFTHPTGNHPPPSVPNVTTDRRSMYVDPKRVSDLRDPPRKYVNHEGPVRLYEGWTLHRTPQSVPPNAEFPTATWLRCTQLETPWSYEILRNIIWRYVSSGRTVPQDYLELSVYQRHQIERLLRERRGLQPPEAFEVIIEALETFPEGATKFQVKSIQLVLHRRPRVGAINNRVTRNGDTRADAIPLQTPVEPMTSRPPRRGKLDPAAPADLFALPLLQRVPPPPKYFPSPPVEASTPDAASFASFNGTRSSLSTVSSLTSSSKVVRVSSPARKGTKSLLDIFGKKPSKDQANTKVRRRGGRHGVILKGPDGSDQGGDELKEQSIPQTAAPQIHYERHQRASHLDSQNKAAVRQSYLRDPDLFPSSHHQPENTRRPSGYLATNTDIPYQSMLPHAGPDEPAFMSPPLPFSGIQPTRFEYPLSAFENSVHPHNAPGQPFSTAASRPSMGYLTYPTTMHDTGRTSSSWRGMTGHPLGDVQLSRSLGPTEDVLKDLYAKYGDPRNDPDTISMNRTGP